MHTLFLITTYLIGAIPSGWIIAKKVRGIDIRKMGSGNIGATNVARNLGKRWGLITLILDILKGFVPVLAGIELFYLQKDVIFLAGIIAVIGHQFSIYQGFRGGKGVATAFGVFLVISPVSALLSSGFFLFLALLSGYISVGSIGGAISLPVFVWILDADKSVIIISIIIALLIIIKHNDNIKRLLKGEELSWRR